MIMQPEDKWARGREYESSHPEVPKERKRGQQEKDTDWDYTTFFTVTAMARSALPMSLFQLQNVKSFAQLEERNFQIPGNDK